MALVEPEGPAEAAALDGGLWDGRTNLSEPLQRLAVGAALAEAVLAGDAAALIVDSELPLSFRWIREAIADPVVTTKRIVYGAAKSLDNVGVFRGQFSLRTAKEAIEGTAQHIGKHASAALLLTLSGELLHLSGALPFAWPWLERLLEAAAKVVQG